MENSKSNFEALVAKMEALKETEQGKLKGGIKVLPVVNMINPNDENNGCTNGNCNCH